MPPPELSAIFKGTVFVSAGEPSADVYAALFIKQLRREKSGARFIGVGGQEMAAAGVELTAGFGRMMSFGFTAAVQNVDGNLAMYRRIARELYDSRPDFFMPVAYPGLNLPLCRYAKKLGIRTYYLLPPQIWAWGDLRKYFIRKWIDLAISLFPFEYEFYRRSGIPCLLVDNPLVDHLKSYVRTDTRKTIGLMPGSRASEIMRNIPVITMIMDQLKADHENHRLITILWAKQYLPDMLNPIAHQNARQRYQTMKNCDFLITCSGTASLEAELMNIPQVFFNRPSMVDQFLVRPFLSINEYNLANLYFGEHRVPALVSRDCQRLGSHIRTNLQAFLRPK